MIYKITFISVADLHIGGESLGNKMNRRLKRRHKHVLGLNKQLLQDNSTANIESHLR